MLAFITIFVKRKEKFVTFEHPTYLRTLRRFIALKCYLCYPHTIREWRKEGFGFGREGLEMKGVGVECKAREL